MFQPSKNLPFHVASRSSPWTSSGCPWTPQRCCGCGGSRSGARSFGVRLRCPAAVERKMVTGQAQPPTRYVQYRYLHVIHVIIYIYHLQLYNSILHQIHQLFFVCIFPWNLSRFNTVLPFLSWTIPSSRYFSAKLGIAGVGNLQSWSLTASLHKQPWDLSEAPAQVCIDLNIK